MLQNPQRRADIECLYVKRESLARGLIHLELTYKTTTKELKKYLHPTTDWMLQLQNTYEKQKKKIFNDKESKSFTYELKPTPKEIDIKIDYERNKGTRTESIKNSCEQKPLHGQYDQRVNADINIVKTNWWLKSGRLETKGLITAAQDQSLTTKNYQPKL